MSIGKRQCQCRARSTDAKTTATRQGHEVNTTDDSRLPEKATWSVCMRRLRQYRAAVLANLRQHALLDEAITNECTNARERAMDVECTTMSERSYLAAVWHDAQYPMLNAIVPLLPRPMDDAESRITALTLHHPQFEMYTHASYTVYV